MDFLKMLVNYRTPFGNLFFQSITLIAQELFVVMIICWLYWCQNKKCAYTLGFTYFISGLFVQGLKITFRIPRPWILDSSFQPVSSAVPAATGYSFPSGHTQSGTALFSTLGMNSAKFSRKFLCFLLIILIGFSRLYLGVHTPKDVLTSMILTLIISVMVFFFLSPILTNPAFRKHITATLFAGCFFLSFYAGFLYIEETVDPKMAVDALKAASAGFGFAVGYYIERTYIQFTLPEEKKEKALRFLAGLISIIVLMLIFQCTIKKFLIGNILSYFLLILWIVAGYPAVFQRYAEKNINFNRKRLSGIFQCRQSLLLRLPHLH